MTDEAMIARIDERVHEHTEMIGRISATQTVITNTLDSVSNDVRTIRETLAEKKGERNALLWAGSMLGALAGFIASLVHTTVSRP